MARKIVCLDAGHGDHDSGAVGPNGLKEKDANLEVVLLAEEYLKPYVDVVLTRRTDKFLSLSDRPAISNAANADVFVSYHFNAGSRTVKLSWEIFTSRGQNRSDILADKIGLAHDSFFSNSQSMRADRSDGDLDKEANFTVITGTRCPACLMEGEFISTPHGELSIRNNVNQRMRARAVAVGVLDFLEIPHTLKKWDTSNDAGVTIIAEPTTDGEVVDKLLYVIGENNKLIASMKSDAEKLEKINEHLKEAVEA